MQREYVFIILIFRWALSNFCRGKPFPTFTFIAPAIPTFAQLLHHEDKEILIDAAWGLAYSSEGENRIDAIISTGCLKRIVELLRFVLNLQF